MNQEALLGLDTDVDAPLAERMRPRSIGEIAGQSALFGPDAALRRLIEADRIRSVILWGPPGTGKTTVAEVIARDAGCRAEFLSAVSVGVKDLRRVIDSALEVNGSRPLLFLDEVHRLNKNQQDVLLPALEKGVVRFVGATTENPSFALNNAILSRCLVFAFKPLSPQEIVDLLQRAMCDPKTVARYGAPKLTQDLLLMLAKGAGGDARKSLTLLEAVLDSAEAGEGPIDVDAFQRLGESMSAYFDRAGDTHYDLASALIKSIRASQPDAALHYLARMLDGGEQPEFIVRRLVISASEDVGNANPHLLSFTNAAAQSVHMVGMPEARIILAQITTLLAASPKSDRSYRGLEEALADVRRLRNLTVPLHLRNAPTGLMKDMGCGKGYVNPHRDADGAAGLNYLPDELCGKQYYYPKNEGYEKHLVR